MMYIGHELYRSLYLLASRSTVFSLCILLSACSPTFNWRTVHGTNAPYSVLLPAKPTVLSRLINLDGTQITMTMTAAEVEDTVFAVGNATIPKTTQAQAALNAMKIALLRNLNGTTKKEQANVMTHNAEISFSMDLEAVSTTATGAQPRILFAHLVNRDQEIYQVVVLGPEKTISRENVDIFMTSFKHD